MTKVRLKKAALREVKDLTSPEVVQGIWAEASKTVRAEVPVVQRRRRRSAQLATDPAATPADPAAPAVLPHGGSPCTRARGGS